MKCLTAAISIFLLLALISRADTTTDQVGHYSAVFPGAITHDTDTTNIASGSIKLYETLCSSSAGAYLVGYGDISVPASTSLDAAKCYQDAIDNALASNKGKLRSQKECKLGGLVGQEYIMDISSINGVSINAVARERMFLVGTRFYQVIYTGLAGTENDQSTLDFLNSFRVVVTP